MHKNGKRLFKCVFQTHLCSRILTDVSIQQQAIVKHCSHSEEKHRPWQMGPTSIWRCKCHLPVTLLYTIIKNTPLVLQGDFLSIAKSPTRYLTLHIYLGGKKSKSSHRLLWCWGGHAPWQHRQINDNPSHSASCLITSIFSATNENIKTASVKLGAFSRQAHTCLRWPSLCTHWHCFRTNQVSEIHRKKQF